MNIQRGKKILIHMHKSVVDVDHAQLMKDEASRK